MLSRKQALQLNVGSVLEWMLFSQALGYRQLLACQSVVGKPSSLLGLPRSELIGLGLKPEVADQLSKPCWDVLSAQYERIKELGGFCVSLSDEFYPEPLRHINSPPLLLYGLGNKALLRSLQVAIVGSRKPTMHGGYASRQLGEELAANGVTVTSGLAMGIDCEAHLGALAADGGTIACIGTGLDLCYPARNRELSKVIAQRGLLLSEYMLGTKARAFHFPCRNRIISGMSLGVVVVEAAIKSGSLITARQALTENREVFAVPGSIYSPVSAGCHQLISQGAKLVSSVKDILEELPSPDNLKIRMQEKVGMDGEFHPKTGCQREVFNKVGFVRVSLDSLVQVTGYTVKEVMAALCELELQGVILKVKGGVVRSKGTQYERERA